MGFYLFFPNYKYYNEYKKRVASQKILDLTHGMGNNKFFLRLELIDYASLMHQAFSYAPMVEI